MSEESATNGRKVRREKLRKLIEQAEVLGSCDLPDQTSSENEALANELIKIRSSIRKREQKCENQSA
jgi:hypothetical protein